MACNWQRAAKRPAELGRGPAAGAASWWSRRRRMSGSGCGQHRTSHLVSTRARRASAFRSTPSVSRVGETKRTSLPTQPPPDRASRPAAGCYFPLPPLLPTPRTLPESWLPALPAFRLATSEPALRPQPGGRLRDREPHTKASRHGPVLPCTSPRGPVSSDGHRDPAHAVSHHQRPEFLLQPVHRLALVARALRPCLLQQVRHLRRRTW